MAALGKISPYIPGRFQGVLTVARLCLGLKIQKKKNVLSNGCRSLTALVVILRQMPEHKGSIVGDRARWNPGFPGNKHAQWLSHRRSQ